MPSFPHCIMPALSSQGGYRDAQSCHHDGCRLSTYLDSLCIQLSIQPDTCRSSNLAKSALKVFAKSIVDYQGAYEWSKRALRAEPAMSAVLKGVRCPLII